MDNVSIDQSYTKSLN